MRKQDLYELVESLTAAEKKVFKERYAGKAEGNFTRLFDAIAAGEVKKDEDVKQKFKGEKFTGHLHKTKAYLYDALLNTLIIPLKDEFIRVQIFQLLQQAEVLLSRKLITQAETMLNKAAELSREYEESELELLIEHELAMVQSFTQKTQKDLTALLQVQEKLEEHIAYTRFYFEVQKAYSQRGQKNAPSVESFADKPLFTSSKKLKSTRALRTREVTKSLVYTVLRQYNQALQSNYAVVDMTLKTPHTSSTREAGLVNALFNVLTVQQSLGLPVNDSLKQLETFEPYSRLGKAQKFVCVSRVKLNAYLTGKRTQRGKQLIDWALKELQENEAHLSELELVKLHFTIAALLLKEGEFDKSLDFLFRINNSKEARENRTIIYRVTQLYQLIAWYELEDFERLSTQLRNYRYYQKKDDAFYIIEKMTFEFLNKAIHLKTKKERQILKQHFEADLVARGELELRSGLAYLRNIDWI